MRKPPLFMRDVLRAVLGLTALLCSSLAQAHDPVSGYGAAEEVAINSGVMLEREDPTPQLVIAVSYSGYEKHGSADHFSYRYFVVTGQAFLATTDDGSVFDALNLEIVPFSKVEAASNGVTKVTNYMPIEVRRHIDMGYRASVKVEAIGWIRHYQRQLGEDSHFMKFAQIAVDVIGLRYAALVNESRFLGAQLGSISFLGGLGWNINEKATLNLSIGGAGDFALGKRGDELSTVADGEVFKRIEFLLNTGFGRLRLHADAGYHATNLPGREHEHTHLHEGTHDGHSHDPASGHAYLIIGTGLAF